METLKKAFATGDPGSELAQKAADLHKQWLSFTWPSYSKEAHAGQPRATITAFANALPIVKKLMRALLKCMWMMRDLQNSMTKSSLVWLNF